MALLVSGCSSKQLYDFGRDAGRAQAQCDRLTSYDERVKCEADFARDYEEYQAEREALRREGDNNS